MSASEGEDHSKAVEGIRGSISAEPNAGADTQSTKPAVSPLAGGSIGSHPPVPPGLSGPAAFLVMALASLTVGAIIALLAAHIWIVEGKYERNQLSDWGLSACQYEPCAQQARLLTLESEAQALRTDRIRTAQLSRLFVFIVAEVAGFALLVMGAVLVFDRVIARHQESVTASKNWSARSEFPGLLMCFLGAMMIIWTVQSANRTAGFFEVFDRPVFISDPNWYRNQLGLPSGSRPNLTPEDISSTPTPLELAPSISLLPPPETRQAPIAVPPVMPGSESETNAENTLNTESQNLNPSAQEPETSSGGD